MRIPQRNRVPLTRSALMRRDNYKCAYCGRHAGDRPRDPAQPGRRAHLGELRRLLQDLQPPQGGPVSIGDRLEPAGRPRRSQGRTLAAHRRPVRRRPPVGGLPRRYRCCLARPPNGCRLGLPVSGASRRPRPINLSGGAERRGGHGLRPRLSPPSAVKANAGFRRLTANAGITSPRISSRADADVTARPFLTGPRRRPTTDDPPPTTHHRRPTTDDPAVADLSATPATPIACSPGAGGRAALRICGGCGLSAGVGRCRSMARFPAGSWPRRGGGRSPPGCSGLWVRAGLGGWARAARDADFSLG